MSLGNILQSVKRKGFALGMGALLLSTGCLQTPNMEYVTNKENQGNYTYVENNNTSGTIAEQIGAPSHVEQECKTLNDHTTITIDADVLVSTEKAVPVYSISPLPITEDMLKFYVGRVYDGEVYRAPYNPYDESIRTQEVVRKEMEEYQDYLDTLTVVEGSMEDDQGNVLDEKGNIITGGVSREHYESLQNELAAFQQELLTAPEEKDLFREVSYEWEPETTTYHLARVSDIGMEADYYQDYNFEEASFVGQRQGRRFYLTCTKDNRYSMMYLTMDRKEELGNGYQYGQLFIKQEVDSVGSKIDNQCRYTKEEAEELCRDFLEELELRDVDVQTVKHIQFSYMGNPLNFQGYRVYCYRTYNGMGDTIYNGLSMYDGWVPSTVDTMYDCDYETETFEEIPGYNREMVVFTVLDEGIVDVRIINPMENQEQLAENTKLMDFESILNQGAAQLSVLHGEDGDYSNQRMLLVNTIQLNYACMESPNGNQEYTMVPVWDFKSGPSGVIYVTINAVDGTVLDRSVGH